ncbi:glycine receptor subunit beta-type 4-like [Amphibalanus amphitrite]|uniref:glycine receptor subunit beta-type 4-like n=1 Tax=Amphibalanus amphitrite TaxID=1232801 RepID=UPI001C91F774|nr:glycine receptor subunit beta-type 4-like [Amphibalanus amphitrite]
MGRTGTGRTGGLLLLVVILINSLQSASARTDAEIFDMLVKGYKPEEAPDRYGANAGYIEVGVRAMLESIAVDEKGSAVTFQCLQRLTWDDIRLRYRSAPAAGGLVISHATAGVPTAPRIWLPSLMYPRALMVDFDNSMDNSFLVRPNGTITWQRRVHVMVPCEMQLDSFPWDENSCVFTIRQDLDGEVLMLNWTRVAGRPVQAGPHFSVTGFELTSLGVSSYTVSPNDITGESLRSKSLVMRVTLKRQSDYYVINDVIPTSILVVAAYMTFWLPPEAVMVRSLVSSFMLLACFLVSAITGRAAPLATSLTALNVWNLVCLVLLLWPLVQSLVVYHMSRRPSGGGGSGESGGVGTLPKPMELNGNGEADVEAISPDPSLPPPPAEAELGPLPPRPSLRPQMVDVVSRVLYLLAFVVTAIVFGVLYS